MPALSFNIQVHIDNPETLPEIQGRIANLEPAFQAIFLEWVGLNKTEKFASSRGMEQSGADVDGEFWAAVTPEYFKEKHPSGESHKRNRKIKGGGIDYADWLMVRTGALKAAMTNPDALFQNFEEQMATFGMPTDSFLADLVMWQSGARQKNRFVVFLGDSDQNAIKRIIQDYLSLGPDFTNIRMAQGLAAVGYAPVDALGMEADFEEPGL